MTGKHKMVIVLSGGLDSTTLLYDAIEQGFEVSSAVSFNYGQRHKKELDFALRTCQALGIPWRLIDLHRAHFTDAIAHSGSSLVSSTSVPEGHYAEENMKATVVPNRNMIMLSISAAIAVADGAAGVGTAVHAGDHFIYPDCRPEFVAYASEAMRTGNIGFGDLEGVWAPYIMKSKADIAEIAFVLGIDFSKTWSCYKGGSIHCGKCGTCVERLEAIDEAARRHGKSHIEWDQTKYEDSTFWIDTIARGAGN